MVMGSPCIECLSKDTEWYRGDDDHFRKECNECGHVGGPYVSTQGTEGETGGEIASTVPDNEDVDTDGSATLDEFL